MTNKNENRWKKKKLNLTVINFFSKFNMVFLESCVSIATALKFKTTEKKHKHIQKDISSKTNIFQKRLTLGFLSRLSDGVCSAVVHQPLELTKKSFFHK